MKFLSGTPSAPISIFTQVFDDQTHIPHEADFGLRMPEPEAMDTVFSHQSLGFRDQRGRCGCLSRICAFGNHGDETLA